MMETRFADLPTSEKGVPCHSIGRFNILGIGESVTNKTISTRTSRIGYSAVCHLPINHDGSHAGLVVWEGEWEDEDAP